MSSESTFINNNEETINEDETFENVVDLKAQISKLSVENESYRQQLHELHRKLETTETMHTELVETNEALEQSLEKHKSAIVRKIHEIEEKYMARRTDLEEKIEEMAAELDAKSKENGELREKIKISNDALSTLSNAQLLTTNKEDNTALLESQLEEISELLAQETEIRKQLEAAIENRESQCNEMKEILAASKRQQAEKDEMLESMKEQLMNYRMELESSKTTVENVNAKGNSLFAEVEDRRKITLEQMNAMKNSYLKAKRSFQAKEAEIRALKFERTMFLRKWEDDTVEKVQEDANLIDKYKARIAKLETQLSDEKKKRNETAPSSILPENEFPFLQSLLNTKNKEIEELRKQIENDAIHALLEEEMKHKMGRQLRHWRMRAMTGEAKLLSIKNRLETDPSSSNAEILETMKTSGNNIRIEPNDNSLVYQSYREPTIVNETIVTLEDLMKVPKPIIVQHPAESAAYFSENNEKIGETLSVSSCESSFSTCTESTEMNDDDFANDKLTVKSTDPKPREVLTVKKEPITDFQECDPSPTVEGTSEEIVDENIPVLPILKSSLAKPIVNRATIFTGKDANDKNTKTLRFTADTIDPPGKILKKQPATEPKYPIIFISGKKVQKK